MSVPEIMSLEVLSLWAAVKPLRYLRLSKGNE